jgi:hypothetical protein
VASIIAWVATLHCRRRAVRQIYRHAPMTLGEITGVGHRPLIGLIGLIPLVALGSRVGRPLGQHPHPGAIARLRHYRIPSTWLLGLRQMRLRLRLMLQLMLWLRLSLRLRMKRRAKRRASWDGERHRRPMGLLGGLTLHSPAPPAEAGRGQVGRLPLEALRNRVDRISRNC